MRRLIALLAVVAIAAPIATAHAQAPKIEIDEMLHDMGEVFQRDTYKHGFSVKNTGDADLVIEKVKPSCGCTVAEYDEVIAPGKVGMVYLEVIDEKITAGAFNSKASIHSNDPDHPMVTVAVKGVVRYHVEVNPGEKVYLRGMYGEPVMRELTIHSPEKQDNFEITGLRSNIDDKITYAAEPAGEPGVYTIKVWKNPKMAKANTWGALTIASNSEHSPERVVQVNVNTRGSIIAQPATINFGTVTEDRLKNEPSLVKSVTVFKIKGEFDIRDVRFSSSYYEADIEAIEEGAKYKVTVRFEPNAVKMSYMDEMIVRTNDPQEPEIRIRLIARGS